ncbi:peptide chain release factor 2 (RF-2) [Candidatus Blochmanniella floridana]|uniref:Peptide chain release factor 2 n=1 Tax=Blochmanniella floridana TaxID=203907 RepID=Q7VRF6_BLOFL|nr:peptide chain release factor 2 (RF-2) [Candidatus Blochmannia floridanus]
MRFNKKLIVYLAEYMYLRIVFDCNVQKELLKKIIVKLKSVDIWSSLSHNMTADGQCNSFENIGELVNYMVKDLQDLSDLIKIVVHNDSLLINEIQEQLIHIDRILFQLEMCQMFSKKYDDCNCYVDIQSGSGGTEAQDWANMLLRMYLKWIDNKGFNVEIVTESCGDFSGIKSTTIKVIGPYVYGWLRTESGIHRLVRKSPFDATGKRHTSFASVFVYPELDDNIDIQIRPEDLRIDVYRASGAGGQHVNRTESAVRITHIPTNIVTQCQSDRSQHKNKNQAIKQLKAKLYNFELHKKRIEKKIRENKKKDITWGNQIRSYVLDHSRIKDLRTGLEKHNVKAVLNGDLDDFIKTSIKVLDQNNDD